MKLSQLSIAKKVLLVLLAVVGIAEFIFMLKYSDITVYLFLIKFILCAEEAAVGFLFRGIERWFFLSFMILSLVLLIINMVILVLA